MPIKNQHISQISGFTLLEVMIAMLIFSIGMLGLAGIQAISLKNNNTAYLRTVAMQQSYNMSDLLRSSVNFDGSVDSNFAAVTTTLGSEPAACFFDSVSVCNSSAMAAFNIWHWKNQLKSDLPSGRGTVTLNAITGVYEIIIMWDEQRNGAINEGCDPNDAGDLKCYKLQIQV